MGVNIGIVQDQAPNVTGVSDFTVDGFGTPKAAIFMASHGHPLEASTMASFGIGVYDGVSGFSQAVSDQDNQGTVRSHFGASSTSVTLLDDSLTNYSWKGEYDSFIPSGVRLNWATAQNGVSPTSGTFTSIFFTGDDLSAKVGWITVSGATTYNVGDIGFEPDVIFGYWEINKDSNASTNPTRTTVNSSHGVATNSTGGVKQFGVTWHNTDNVGTVAYAAAVSSGYILGGLGSTGASFQNQLSVDSFTSSGVTITLADATDQDTAFKYLALKFNDTVKFDVRTINIPNSTGNISYSDIGFQPNFLYVIPTLINGAFNTSIQNSEAGSFNTACVDSSGNAYTAGMGGDNGVGTSNCSSMSTKQISCVESFGTSVDVDLVSYDSDGFTLDVSSAPGDNNIKFIVLSMETGVVPTVARQILIPSWIFQAKGGLTF